MNNYPVIKLTLIFTGGIIFPAIIHINVLLFLTVSAIFFILSLLIFFTKITNRQLLLSITLGFCIFFSAAAYSSFRDLNQDHYPFKEQRIKNAIISGEVERINLPSNGEQRFVVRVDSVRFPLSAFHGKFSVLCKMDNFKSFELEPGNYIEGKCRIYKPRDERNPGEFDYYKYLLSKDISAQASIKKLKDIRILDSSSELIPNFIYHLRLAINDKINGIHSTEAASLIKGLLLADRSEIDYNTKEKFINSGVVHILAVSGLHVGFIVMIFFILFNRFDIYFKYAFTVAGIIIFYLITAGQPSVFRASLMAVVFILSFLTNRSYNPFNSLAIAALILLSLDPSEIANPGFQLSFSAVTSILIFYPIFREKINSLNFNSRSLRGLLLFIAVSTSAQIGTLPFTLLYFKKLSVIAIAANLIVIPLTGMIIAVGLLTVTLAGIFPWIAGIFGMANNLLAFVLIEFVDFAGGLKFSHFDITYFTGLEALIFYICLFAYLFLRKIVRNRTARIIIMIFLTADFFLFTSFSHGRIIDEGELNVISMDIGQGDAALLVFPNGKSALVDAGNAVKNYSNGERVIVPLMERLGIERINYAFISHVDADHYKGLLYLIERGLVDTVYKPDMIDNLEKDIRFEKLLSENKITVNHYQKSILKIGGAQIYFLNDSSSIFHNSLSVNGSSGVLKLIYGNTSFLFTGDAEYPAEKCYVSQYGDFLNSDILKVSHHGSKTGSSNEFLSKVKPQIAVISCGIQNKFGHPHREVLRRLEKNNSKILRTDQEGAIIFHSNGRQIFRLLWR